MPAGRKESRSRAKRPTAAETKRRAAQSAEAKPDGAAPANGVFVLVERSDDGAGIASVTSVAQGDVRPAEIPTILETAVRVVRGNLGLDSK